MLVDGQEVDEEVNDDAGETGAASVAQSEEDLMQQKFQKLRLLRTKGRSSHQRRPLLPSPASKDEADVADDLFLAPQQIQSECDQEKTIHFRSQPRPSI